MLSMRHRIYWFLMLYMCFRIYFFWCSLRNHNSTLRDLQRFIMLSMRHRIHWLLMLHMRFRIYFFWFLLRSC